MSKTVNRKNNCTVHFMVNEEDMKELNRRFALRINENFIEMLSLKTRLSALIYQEILEKN